MHTNYVLKEFLLYNKITHNGFCNILNIQMDFKRNIIFTNIYWTILHTYFTGVLCVQWHIHGVGFGGQNPFPHRPHESEICK